jgi:hypothetical protein
MVDAKPATCIGRVPPPLSSLAAPARSRCEKREECDLPPPREDQSAGETSGRDCALLPCRP